MTLKEKFKKCKDKSNSYYILPIADDAEQLEKIADEFAEEFLYWYQKKLTVKDNGLLRINVRQVLKQFKKEKGL